MKKTTPVKISAAAKDLVDHLLGRGFTNHAIKAIAANSSYATEKKACIDYAVQCRGDGTTDELIDIWSQETTAWKLQRVERRDAAIVAKKEAAKNGKTVAQDGEVKPKRTICRVKIFGAPVTAVLRAIGLKGELNVDDALRVVIELGAETISITTVRIQLAAGRRGLRGTPAKLSGRQWDKIAKLAN